MRVLLLSPFPISRAANDASAQMLPDLVDGLAERVELFVYAPAGEPDAITSSSSATFIPFPAVRGGGLRKRLGARPYWQVESWSAAIEADVRRVVTAINPAVVHGEYLHVGASTARSGRPSVITLHDVATDVIARGLAGTRGIERPYRFAEYCRTRLLERRVVEGVDVPVALSDADRASFLRWNRRCQTIAPAIEPGSSAWTADPARPPAIVFTGAMWRNANIAAARYLVKQVMPLVRMTVPAAVLRIVGAEPTAEVRSWDGADGIQVLGRVDDLDVEMLRASVIAAPSVFGGGILVKCLGAANLGCPVVTTTSVAAALGFDRSQVATADTAEAFAAATVRLLAHPGTAADLGAAARRAVRERFGWGHRIAEYHRIYEQLAS